MSIKLYHISVLLSLGCIIIAFKINYDLALSYNLATGKSQSLIVLNYLDRYNYVILGVLALIASSVSLIKKENRALSFLSIFLSLAAMTLTFIDIWKLWIK